MTLEPGRGRGWSHQCGGVSTQVTLRAEVRSRRRGFGEKVGNRQKTEPWDPARLKGQVKEEPAKEARKEPPPREQRPGPVATSEKNESVRFTEEAWWSF